MNPVRLYACLLKRRYPSAVAAWRQVRRQRKRYRDEMRAYHCPFCGQYHLTKEAE